jgi:hypothetical protein
LRREKGREREREREYNFLQFFYLVSPLLLPSKEEEEEDKGSIVLVWILYIRAIFMMVDPSTLPSLPPFLFFSHTYLCFFIFFLYLLQFPFLPPSFSTTYSCTSSMCSNILIKE